MTAAEAEERQSKDPLFHYLSSSVTLTGTALQLQDLPSPGKHYEHLPSAVGHDEDLPSAGGHDEDPSYPSTLLP